MQRAYLERFRKDPHSANPLFARLGIQLVSIGDGRIELLLPCRPDLLQDLGMLSGGVQAALLDEAMAHAVMTTLGEGESTATMDLHVRYLTPGGKQDLIAEATVVRRGSRVVVAQGEVREAGKVLSMATASFIILS